MDLTVSSMPLSSDEVCLIVSLVAVLLLFGIYLYFDSQPEPVVYQKPAIGSYHTSWCRDLD